MEETSSRSMHAVPFAYLALKLEIAIFIKREGMKYGGLNILYYAKCNVDAAFLEVFSGGATAAVFRDHAENLLTASNFRIAASSPLAAEALA
ncbi:hypothetical protein S245_036124, partial [Arachis hypogaea]